MRKLAWALLAAVSVAATGCGAKAATAADTTTVGATVETTAVQTNGAEEIPTIYFLSKILGSSYWSIVEQGAKDAGEELGVNVVVTGLSSDSEIEKQMQQLQDAVAAGAAGIVIAPSDGKAMTNAVNDAYTAGIPLVIIDGLVDSDSYDAAVLTDNYECGKMMAEEMLNRFHEMGISEDEPAEVAAQIASSGSQTQIQRLDGFNEYWNEHAPEKWVVLNNDVKVNDSDISKAISYTQDFLMAYPNLRGCFGITNGATVGFSTGLKEAGRTDIVMVGADTSDEVLELIREGEFNVVTIAQQPHKMGYEGVRFAYELSQGKAPTEKIMQLEVVAIDKDNINTPEVQEILKSFGK